MAAEQGIKDAEYFLDKITQAATREDFVPNLTAFLTAARSIPDFLLEDFNTKLGLNIPLTRNLHAETFEKEAKKLQNKAALNFVIEYKSELGRLYADPIGNLLIKKRNISVHRSRVSVQGELKRNRHETISSGESVSIEVRDNYGNLKKNGVPTDTKSKPRVLTDEESTPPDSVKWYFENYQNDDVVIACKKFIDLLRSFVATLKDKFP
jgi:hypothetical protein